MTVHGVGIGLSIFFLTILRLVLITLYINNKIRNDKLNHLQLIQINQINLTINQSTSVVVHAMQ